MHPVTQSLRMKLRLKLLERPLLMEEEMMLMTTYLMVRRRQLKKKRRFQKRPSRMSLSWIHRKLGMRLRTMPMTPRALPKILNMPPVVISPEVEHFQMTAVL